MGRDLSELLNNLIEAQETDERSRDDVVGDMADAGGVSRDIMNQIINGEIDCPFVNFDNPRERYARIAEILDTSAARLIEAAESDDCAAPGGSASRHPPEAGKRYKAGAMNLKALTDEGKFEGITAVFGNVDDGLDMIMPGAFVKSISERGKRIKGFWQHDLGQPAIGITLELKEVKRGELPSEVIERAPDALGGLFVHGQILPTSLGKDVLIGMRAGVINEMSIGYDLLQYDIMEGDQKNPGYYYALKELRLWEWSPVNWGMNPATTIGEVKALEAYLVQSRHPSPTHLKHIKNLVDFLLAKSATQAQPSSPSAADGDEEMKRRLMFAKARLN